MKKGPAFAWSIILIVLSQIAIPTVHAPNFSSEDYSVQTTTGTVSDRPPVIQVISLFPNPATRLQAVKLNFSVFDPDGLVTTTWVDWGDGPLADLLFNVTSGSMCQRLNPGLNSNACTLAPGDVVFAQRWDPAIIANNSIIIFRPSLQDPTYLVIHRIIKVIPAAFSPYNQVTFWTMGDANGVPDAWDTPGGGIPGGQVVGLYLYTMTPSAGSPTARYDTHTYDPSYSGPALQTFTIHVNATDDSGYSSSMDRTVIVTRSVTVSCAASEIEVGVFTTCSVNVGGVSPSGEASFFSASLTGVFLNRSLNVGLSYTGRCLLYNGGCSVTYVDESRYNTSAPITASYTGDSNNVPGYAIFNLYIVKPSNTILTEVGASFLRSGQVRVDESTRTGVFVSVTGAGGPDGTPVAVSSRELSSPSAGVGSVGLGGAKYYDVMVSGIASGRARVCIVGYQRDSLTTMEYWDGMGWIVAADVAMSGLSVCGVVSVSVLTGTNVAVGDLPSGAMTIFGLLPILFYSLVGVLIVVVAVAGYVAIRRRRSGA